MEYAYPVKNHSVVRVFFGQWSDKVTPLAPEKHPLGYTLLQKNMKNMMMARIKKCGTLDNVPRMILEKTAIVHQEEDNMRYIMSSTSFPYL
jgi:hypothetical protein